MHASGTDSDNIECMCNGTSSAVHVIVMVVLHITK